MLSLQATGLGRQFYHQWVIKGQNWLLPAGGRLAVLGPNGSGKSTLLRLLAGELTPTQGGVQWELAGKNLPQQRLYQQLAWCAPGVALPLSLTLQQLYRLHFRFKPCTRASITACLDALELTQHQDKLLGEFSSGMLQRAKLGLALFTAAPLLLLDEPTTNLDALQTQRMLQLIQVEAAGRTLVLASNQAVEYEWIAERLQLGA